MDNDLEVTIVQGTNFNVAKPKDVDTYVKLEFPWPTVSTETLFFLFETNHFFFKKNKKNIYM